MKLKLGLLGLIMKNLVQGAFRGLLNGTLGMAEISTYFQRIIVKRSLKIRLPKSLTQPQNLRILAICCYMADRPSLVENLLKSVEESKFTQIDLVITNNTDIPSSATVKPYVQYVMPKTPKFVAVARIIKDNFRSFHDYVIVIDDDVRLSAAFFDRYFRVAKGLGLVLSQPALTRDSFGFHRCCYQIDEAIAHLVSFVEIGPVTCFDRRIIPLLCLDGSPMGWGLDFVWARICRDKRWPMGVIDLVSVQHTLREVAKGYDKNNEVLLMNEFLSKTRHLPLYVRDIVGQTIFKKHYPELS
jgi:hypothetical protein